MGKNTPNGSAPVGFNQFTEAINRLSDKMDVIHETVNKNTVALARLQVKSGIWGLLGGLIPVIILLIGLLIKSKVVQG